MSDFHEGEAKYRGYTVVGTNLRTVLTFVEGIDSEVLEEALELVDITGFA